MLNKYYKRFNMNWVVNLILYFVALSLIGINPTIGLLFLSLLFMYFILSYFNVFCRIQKTYFRVLSKLYYYILLNDCNMPYSEWCYYRDRAYYYEDNLNYLY